MEKNKFYKLFNLAWKGYLENALHLPDTPEDKKEKYLEYVIDRHSCKRKDIFCNKKPLRNGIYNKEGKRKNEIAKLEKSYSLEEYLKHYNPEQMINLWERCMKAGFVFKGYGTNTPKRIGDLVQITLTHHILEGCTAEVIDYRQDGKYLIKSNKWGKDFLGYFSVNELKILVKEENERRKKNKT